MKSKIVYFIFVLSFLISCKGRHQTVVQLQESSFEAVEIHAGRGKQSLTKMLTHIWDQGGATDPIAATVSLMERETLANYVLIRAPLGNQEGSESHPRVILVQQDGELVVSYNGDPRHKGYDLLEGFYFDEYRINPFFVDLKKLKKTKENPNSNVEAFAEDVLISSQGAAKESCVKCHSHSQNLDDIRFAWQIYPRWTGTYGSFDDILSENIEPKIADTQDLKGEFPSKEEYISTIRNEFDSYTQKYIPTRKKNPRYLPLLLSSRNPAIGMFTDQYKDLYYSYRPNLRISLIFNLMNMKRVYGKILRSPNSSKRYAFAHQTYCKSLNLNKYEDNASIDDPYYKAWGLGAEDFELADPFSQNQSIYKTNLGALEFSARYAISSFVLSELKPIEPEIKKFALKQSLMPNASEAIVNEEKRNDLAISKDFALFQALRDNLSLNFEPRSQEELALFCESLAKHI